MGQEGRKREILYIHTKMLKKKTSPPMIRIQAKHYSMTDINNHSWNERGNYKEKRKHQHTHIYIHIYNYIETPKHTYTPAYRIYIYKPPSTARPHEATYTRVEDEERIHMKM